MLNVLFLTIFCGTATNEKTESIEDVASEALAWPPVLDNSIAMKPILLAAALLCALFATAVTYGLYPTDISDKITEPLLIRAEAAPIKYRPADPGGMVIPFQNSEVWRLLDVKPVGTAGAGSR